MILSPTRNSIIAALGYGSWAMFANSEYATWVWVKAGLTQAVTSFTTTLLTTLFARWVYRRAGRGLPGVLTGYLTSFLLVLGFAYGMHYASGTPDIWQTIAPSLLIGSGYLISFLLTLNAYEGR